MTAYEMAQQPSFVPIGYLGHQSIWEPPRAKTPVITAKQHDKEAYEARFQATIKKHAHQKRNMNAWMRTAKYDDIKLNGLEESEWKHDPVARSIKAREFAVKNHREKILGEV